MERLRGMLFGAFVADAYALGLHWVYDLEKLATFKDRDSLMMTPSKDSFHLGKVKGEFTHYGDQSLLLLKSIASNNGFSISVFKRHWLTYMTKYEGYMDHASKESIELLDSNTFKGSSSNELGGLARVAPLIYYHFDDPDLKNLVEAETRLTHNNDLLIHYGHYITDVILELVIGKPLIKTIYKVASDYPKILSLLEICESRLTEETATVIHDIGQSCSSQFAFPAVLYLLVKYPGDYITSMNQNVLSGGDSAGRGMVLGMLQGAALGYSQLPQDWLQDIKVFDLINSFTQHKQI